MSVTMEREEDSVGPVMASFLKHKRDESWWLVVGDTSSGTLLAIKRLTLMQKSTHQKLEFDVPAGAGSHQLVLYFMCDSYLGCDQEYKFSVRSKGEADSRDDK